MSATNPELSLSLTKQKKKLRDNGYWLGDLLSAWGCWSFITGLRSGYGFQGGGLEESDEEGDGTGEGG